MIVRRKRHISKPNFLPLLDIIFILLFFFMFSLLVASSTSQIDLDLPKLNLRNDVKGEKTIITLKKNGQLQLFGKTYAEPEIVQKILLEKKIDRIFIAGDGDLPYKEIINLIGFLKKCKIEKVSLLYEFEAQS